MMLDSAKTLLVLIDVQEKLTAVMHDREALVASLVKLVKGMNVLGIPVIWVEQNPAKMGPTLPELQPLLPGSQPLIKTCFSCCGSESFNEAVKASGRRQVLIAGIETHVCVYQTAVALIRDSYAVEATRTVRARDMSPRSRRRCSNCCARPTTAPSARSSRS
jgi:nicotinamidase-related amidase